MKEGWNENEHYLLHCYLVSCIQDSLSTKQNASATGSYITTCPKLFFIIIIFENYVNKNYACFKIWMCRLLFHNFHKSDSEVCVLTRHSTEHLKPVLYDKSFLQQLFVPNVIKAFNIWGLSSVNDVIALAASTQIYHSVIMLDLL